MVIRNVNLLNHSSEIDSWIIDHIINYDLSTVVDVFFQPKINIIDQSVFGFEALSRVVEPYSKHIMLNVLMKVFMRNTELEKKLLKFLLDKVIEFLIRQNSISEEVVPISINVSKRLLSDPDFISILDISLSTYNFPKRTLIIEVLEDSCEEVPLLLLSEKIKILRALGYGVSLDDFGTKDANFETLISCDFSEIKLDRFVLNDIENKSKIMFISFMAKLTESLNMDFVIEGVETERQLNILRNLGVRVCQGFYFSTPISQRSALKFIVSKKLKINNLSILN
ncbi:EAL domain-containing protein [Vibrio metschnikovii]